MGLNRHVIGGASIITLAGAISKILSFFTVPVLSRQLGTNTYGSAVLVGTVVSLASGLAILGIDMAYARYSMYGEGSNDNKVEIFCWRFAIMSSMIASFLAGVYWIYLGHIWFPYDYTSIALYSIIAIFLSVVVVMSTTRARLAGQYRKLAIALVLSAFNAAVISMSVCQFWRADLWAILIGVIISSTTTLLIIGIPKPTKIISPSGLPLKIRKDILLLGFVGSITTPMYWIITSSDRWFLAQSASESVIGIYSMASNIGLLGLILNNALTLIWFSEASRLYRENRNVALSQLGRLWERLVVVLAIIWLAVSACGGDVLRLLTPPQFHSGAIYIPWIAGGVFFYGLADLANTSSFLEGRMARVGISWAIGALASFGLNSSLVPILSAKGAAIVQAISFFFIALSVIISSRKVLPLEVNWSSMGFYIFIIFIIGLFMIPFWSENPLYSLLLKIPFCVLVVSVLIKLFMPDWFKIGYCILTKTFFGS